MSGSITVEKIWANGQYEKNSQDSDSSTATIYYLVRGVDAEEDAVAATESFLRGTAEDIPEWQGIPFNSVSVDERLFEDGWKMAVKYQKKSGGSGGSGESSEIQFGFDISTGNQHVVKSFGQISKLPANAPDSMGINDGDGIDIIAPMCTISETRFFAASDITTQWKKDIAKMVGCINNAEFQGFSAGELLFTGCSGSRNGSGSDNKWQITFRFAVQENQTGIAIGNLGTISKRGWDILWIRYNEDIVTVDNKKVVLRVPKAAYVEQVYKSVDFDNIGL